MVTEWVCLLCPTGAEWVYTFDANTLIGECPHCSFAAGIFPVTEDDTPFATALRAVALAAVQAGRVEYFDEEAK